MFYSWGLSHIYLQTHNLIAGARPMCHTLGSVPCFFFCEVCFSIQSWSYLVSKNIQVKLIVNIIRKKDLKCVILSYLKYLKHYSREFDWDAHRSYMLQGVLSSTITLHKPGDSLLKWNILHKCWCCSHSSTWTKLVIKQGWADTFNRGSRNPYWI